MCSLWSLAITLAVATASLGGPTRAGEPGETESPDAIEQLLENVRYWRARNRPDKAAEAWRKILRSDSRHRDALAELALYEARNGNKKKAKGYLERLGRVAPQHPLIPSINQALGLAKSYDRMLDAARAAVRSGDKQEGLELYREVFGGQPPAGALGVEYYQTLGGMPGRWQEAREGLERIARENDGKPFFALALARHLTYDESTRREGIQRLEALLPTAEKSRAEEAIRRALMWLGVVQSDGPYFERFLQRNPNDDEVRRQWQKFRAGIAARAALVQGRERIASGFKALEAGRLEEAEALFRAALAADVHDSDASSGLASTLMKRERFDEAVQLLTALSKRQPKRKELWAGQLPVARFWASLKSAETLRAESKPAEAEKILRELIPRHPELAPHAELVLANALNDLRRYDEAEPIFEKLAADGDSVGPLLGLFELQLRRGNLDKAIEINQRVRALDPEEAVDDANLRAEILRRQASQAQADGNVAEALRVLQAAREVDPDSRSVLVDMAYLALRDKQLEIARAAVEQLRTLAPDDRDALVVDAWVALAEHRYLAGLEALERVEDSQTDPALRNLKRRFEVRLQINEVVKLATRRKMVAAQTRLNELQRTCKDSPELLGLIANTWADIGRYEQALAAMYDALQVDKNDSPTLKLQLAAILHKARREQEFLQVMSEIEGAPTLTEEERKGFADLSVAWSVRRADHERDKGNFSRAFAYLQRPLKDYPSNHSLMTALGRLFISSGEYEEAYQLFKKVLREDIDNFEGREGAIRSAVELGRTDEARLLARDGLARMGEDPRMLLVAGRMHVMVGEDDEAKDHFERGLALVGTDPAVDAAGVGSMSRLLAGAERRFGKGHVAADQSQTMRLHADLTRELEEIRARNAIRIGTSIELRSRPGEAGLGQLLALQFPTHASISTGNNARLTFTATPVIADSDTLDLGDPQYEGALGTSGVDLFGLAGGDVGEAQAGVELTLAQDIGGLHLEIGSSPLGFVKQTVLGAASLSIQADTLGLRLEGYRRMVEESLLSWSGITDPGSGVAMGGVTANGGRLDLGFDVENVVYYLFGGGAYYIGSFVDSNFGLEAGLGIQWRLYDWKGVTFLTGLEGHMMSFDKNLRHFTLGHGGYFSPQAFVLGSVPLKLMVKKQDVDFSMSLNLGVSWFEEDDAEYYPTDPARQAVRTELTDPDDNIVESTFPGQTVFAFALRGVATLRYRVSPSVALQAQVSVHNGNDYEEYGGALGIVYLFDQKVGGGESELEETPLFME